MSLRVKLEKEKRSDVPWDTTAYKLSVDIQDTVHELHVLKNHILDSVPFDFIVQDIVGRMAGHIKDKIMEELKRESVRIQSQNIKPNLEVLK